MLCSNGPGDLALQTARAQREMVVGLLEQEGVQTAIVVDRAQSVLGDLEADGAVQLVRNDGDIRDVRAKLALRLVVRVADIVPGQHTFAGQFATARHDLQSLSL